MIHEYAPAAAAELPCIVTTSACVIKWVMAAVSDSNYSWETSFNVGCSAYIDAEW